jgi:alpha-tubulin suppressor-like RCC1 family protein
MTITVLDNMEYGSDAAAQVGYVSTGNFPAPIHHYRMNDNASDTNVSDNSGNLNGISYRNTSLMSATGKIGTGLSFNGTSDFISLGTSALNYTDLSICFWLLIKGGNTTQYIFARGPASDVWGDLGIVWVSGYLYLCSSRNSGRRIIEASSVSDGDHFVFLLKSDGTAQVYRNASLITPVDSLSGFGAWNNNITDSFSIGRAGAYGNYYFNGALDDVRIYNSVISPSLISSIYNSATGTEDTLNITYLQQYSESSIISGGSYSLKAIAAQTTSLNKTLTRTITSPINLTSHAYIIGKIRASRTGSNIKIGFHDSGGTTTEITPNITAADTWQTIQLDISAVSDANKDAIDSIIITITNADAENTFYLDNFFAVTAEDYRLGMQVSKTVGYAVLYPIANAMNVSKVVGYAVLTPAPHTRGLRVLDQFEFDTDTAARLAYSTTPELSSVPYGKNAHITEEDGYVTCRFYTSGVFTVPQGVSGNIELLVVGAGGGGGGGYYGGGGGGGGVVHALNYAVTAGNYSVTIGLGGTGAAVANGFRSGNGGDSQFDSVIAIGGGGGGSKPHTDYTTYGPTVGGSGGGGATGPGAAGTDTQGNAGGAGYGTNAGGGGGGFVAAGTAATSTAKGTGGEGVWFNSIQYGSGGNGFLAYGGWSSPNSSDTNGEGGDSNGEYYTGTGRGYNGSDGTVIIKYETVDFSRTPNTIDVASDKVNRIHGGASMLLKANKVASVSKLLYPINCAHCNYVAIRLKANKPGSNLKLRFYNTPTLLTGGTASADSNTTSAVGAVNNWEYSSWTSTSATLAHWWKYDFGVGVQKIAKNLLFKKSYYFNDTSFTLVKSFTIQGSNDDSNWTTLLSSVSSNDYYYNSWHCELIDNNTSYRYYRFSTSDIYSAPASYYEPVSLPEIILSDTPTYFDIVPEVTEANIWKNYEFDISTYTRDAISKIELIVLNDDIDTTYNLESMVASAMRIQGPEIKWSKLFPSSYCTSAIDELGRLFTWGGNDDGNCGHGDCHYDYRPSVSIVEYRELLEITMPTQVGTDTNWVKVDSGEYSTIAINTLGELWGFGNTDDCSSFAMPEDSGSYMLDWTGTYTPPVGYRNRFYTPVRIAPEQLFKDVAHCMYCTLAIGMDNKLYVFGQTDSGTLGLGEEYSEPVHTVMMHPYLTTDIKFVGTKMLCSAVVTTDNKVYGCGDWWGYNSDGSEFSFYSYTFTEVLGLPEGSVITQLAMDYAGILVLLSNGEVWGAGDVNFYANEEDVNDYPDGSSTFVKIPAFEGKVITKIALDCMGSFVMTGIDSSGKIWGVSDDETYIGLTEESVQDYWLLNFDTLKPLQFFAGPNSYIDYMANTCYVHAAAITTEGHLMACGMQIWTPTLALGLSSDEPSDYSQELPIYASYARDAEDWESAGLNLFLTETSQTNTRPTQWIM